MHDFTYYFVSLRVLFSDLRICIKHAFIFDTFLLPRDVTAAILVHTNKRVLMNLFCYVH